MNPTMMMMTPMGLMIQMQQQYWETIHRFTTNMIPHDNTGRSLTVRQPAETAHDHTSRDHTENGEQVIGVGEEYLDVSTRKIAGPATRIVRTVQEIPVEHHVKLEDETIVIERRRPNGHTADGDVLTEREFVVLDTHEVPVVIKGTRLSEEVVVHRKVHRRSETVSDKLKKTDIKVIQPQRAMVKA